VRALLLSPNPSEVPILCEFIRKVLPAEGVNTLVLRLRWSYQFESHPELADDNPLSKADLKEIARACRDAGVRLVPKMNLFAHQSEAEKILPLLAKYPQFDESPDYGPPHPWRDPVGPSDFYSKSLCPQHPDLHPVLFSLMDELLEVTGAGDFHVGMDEVWIIGHPKCPRCGGQDPAELFARHATRLRDHLVERKCRMWMWSDRLIDGQTSGLLGWQASVNGTWRAVDLIPKDILICDWKYEDAPPTPAYFALKGFDVLASPCAKTEAALAQLEMLYLLRRNGDRADFAKPLAARLQGVLESSWMASQTFIEAYHSADEADTSLAKRNADTFKALFAEIRRNAAGSAPA
jgi:hypothetical protein